MRRPVVKTMKFTDFLLAGSLGEMTSFSSAAYLVIFFPASLILYSIVPQKAKKYFLLIESFVFYWLISGNLIIYLILSILSIHYFALWLDRINTQKDAAVKAAESENRKEIKKQYVAKSRRVLALAADLHIGILLVLKYSPFFTGNINSLFEFFGFSFRFDVPSYLQPIGISFFSLQAFSYVFDVYRGTTKADDNIFRLGLFMSFFPQIVEGPICRYEQTAMKLWNVEKIRYENLVLGLERFAYGLLKKIVIADRLNAPVKEMFNNYNEYPGGTVVIAAVFYTIQLYADFSGAMDAVMGVAQIFGVEMPENFRRPFFSKTISEFWQRWHITLGAWFRDYIFYPVTMSKPMKKLTSSARKKLGNHFGPLLAGSIALFCVWLCNGLWHGAGWTYIFFGMYHFVLILIGSMVAPLVSAVNKKLHINPEWFGYRLIQIIRTFVFVVIGELFFRAETLSDGFGMIKKAVTDFTFPTIGDFLGSTFKISHGGIVSLGVALALVFVISLLNEKGVNVRESLRKRNVVLRWILLYLMVMFIFVFGAYGPDYIPVDPIYANF